MSIVCLLLLAACTGTNETRPLLPEHGSGDDGGEPRGTAVFSEASEAQIEVVFSSVYMPWAVAMAEVFTALLDSALSGGACPQREEDDSELTITGEGCVAMSGTVYEGRIEGTFDDDDGFGRLVFEDYSRLDPAGALHVYDGSLELRAEEDEPLVYAIDLLMQTPEARLAVDLSARCQHSDGGTIECTLEPNAEAEIDDLGRFEIEGSFVWGEAGLMGTLVFYGEETMRADILPDGCVRYTIDDGAQQTWCPGEPDDGNSRS